MNTAHLASEGSRMKQSTMRDKSATAIYEILFVIIVLDQLRAPCGRPWWISKSAHLSTG